MHFGKHPVNKLAQCPQDCVQTARTEHIITGSWSACLPVQGRTQSRREAGLAWCHVEEAAQKRRAEPGESAELTADEDKRSFVLLFAYS